MPIVITPIDWLFYSGVAVACVTLLLIAMPDGSR